MSKFRIHYVPYDHYPFKVQLDGEQFDTARTLWGAKRIIKKVRRLRAAVTEANVKLEHGNV